MAWCWVWGRIEHYVTKLYGMVSGIEQDRTLWYKICNMVLGIEQDRALWYKVLWHGVVYGAG